MYADAKGAPRRHSHPALGRGKSLRDVFERHPQCVGQVADCSIETCQHQEFHQGVLGKAGTEARPELVVDIAVRMQCITDAYQQFLFVAPAGICCRAENGRANLIVSEFGQLRKAGYVDSPFVFRATQSRGAVNYDFSLPYCQMTAIQQTAGEKLPGQTRIAGQGREKPQRRAAPHGLVDVLRDIGLKGALCGGDACCHVLPSK